jgi:D-beta-D-heptose 7-phosphate kinase/D-beta-D-heptose 1-phosphate adenosyltransferase
MIETLINGLKQKLNVAVIGDAMLDVYRYGKVSRISPEFPVPILKSTSYRQEFCPGGAANVCYQFKHFNVDSKLIAYVDCDIVQQKYFGDMDIENCIMLDPFLGYKIPRKIRYYDNEFPMLRHDIEDNYTYHDKGKILTTFAKLVDKLDVVILSNYNKGFFNQEIAPIIIDMCRMHGVITIVDPKSNLEWWKKCSVFKLNSSEAKEMTGESDWKKQCNEIKDKLDCGVVIITQAGDGVVGLYDKYFEHRPKQTIKDVSSVIGAGDCFAAILAMCLKFMTPDEAAKLAFAGGTEYVKAKHNRPITLYELHRHINPLNAKIMSVEDLVFLKNQIYKNQKWVFANGCYDILHPGHLSTLQQAKQKGDKLIVALNSDESIKRLKGSDRPIHNLRERSQLIAALECVDFVISFEEDTPYNLVKSIRPNVLAKGGDWLPHQLAGHDLVEEVFIAKTIDGNSTSNIIERIKNLSSV